jgi:glutathione synthase/RimK-type ligase-like ATP-grasp enzyme
MHMTRTIGLLGYVVRPEFDFDTINDRIQAESMLAARGDRMLAAHWDDLDPSTLVTRAWDLRAGRWETADYSRCDAFLILESPAPGSRNADFERVETAMREILRRRIPAVNSVRTFLEYPDKRYLLERRELPFPETALVTCDSDLVLKPLLGCNCKGVMRLPRDADAVRAAMEPGGQYLLQPFLPEIFAGERSLYFFAKQYRYAVLKRLNPGEFRANEEHSVSERYEPTAEELAIATDAIRRFASPSLIERVDMCGRYVLEMTIECPAMKFRKLALQQQAGPWTYEALDMAIELARRGIT